MSTDAEIVGRRIKQLREQKGWTQTQFGARINSSKSQIVRWENGRDFPRIDKRLAIATQLGQCVEILFHAGAERDSHMEDTALAKMLEIARDQNATPAQQLAAAKEMRPKNGKAGTGNRKDGGDMAEFRRMMEKADAELTELLRELGLEDG